MGLVGSFASAYRLPRSLQPSRSSTPQSPSRCRAEHRTAAGVIPGMRRRVRDGEERSYSTAPALGCCPPLCVDPGHLRGAPPAGNFPATQACSCRTSHPRYQRELPGARHRLVGGDTTAGARPGRARGCPRPGRRSALAGPPAQTTSARSGMCTWRRAPATCGRPIPSPPQSQQCDPTADSRPLATATSSPARCCLSSPSTVHASFPRSQRPCMPDSPAFGRCHNITPHRPARVDVVTIIERGLWRPAEGSWMRLFRVGEGAV